jgi:hypothetical protein
MCCNPLGKVYIKIRLANEIRSHKLGAMGTVEVIQKLSEYLYYKSIYKNFSVLLHNYEIHLQAKTLITNSIKEEILNVIPKEEKSFLLEFGEYLEISANDSEKEKFLTYCKTPVSSSEKNELKIRISEIESNPEIGVSWEDAIKGIEQRIGKKINFTS